MIDRSDNITTPSNERRFEEITRGGSFFKEDSPPKNDVGADGWWKYIAQCFNSFETSYRSVLRKTDVESNESEGRRMRVGELNPLSLDCFR